MADASIITIPKVTESYAPHPLQTIDVYNIARTPSSTWLMSVPSTPPLPPTRLTKNSFIHGGAWRDPLVSSTAGHNLLTRLLSGASAPPPLNAASINYRLSPHPSHPHLHEQNTAKHPDHLDDVLAALRHLCVKYGMTDYVLIGHSAGATLSFQCLHELRQRRKGKAAVSGGGDGGGGGGGALREPRMVVGVEGIYDLASLVDEYPQYQGFVEGAFGEEAAAAAVDGRGVWESASPRKFGVSGYKGMVVLAQSDEDTLLSWRQTEEMKEAVERDLGVGGGLRVVKVVGQHHDVVEKCYERLAGVVERYLKEPA